jgi:hypothetical protein
VSLGLKRDGTDITAKGNLGRNARKVGAKRDGLVSRIEIVREPPDDPRDRTARSPVRRVCEVLAGTVLSQKGTPRCLELRSPPA